MKPRSRDCRRGVRSVELVEPKLSVGIGVLGDRMHKCAAGRREREQMVSASGDGGNPKVVW